MSYNAGFRFLLVELGITNQRLPVDGLPPRELFGVKFWVNPLPPRQPGSRFRRFKLRVMCECPECGRVMSASRLKQHANTIACRNKRIGYSITAQRAENDRAFSEATRLLNDA